MLVKELNKNWANNYHNSREQNSKAFYLLSITFWQNWEKLSAGCIFPVLFCSLVISNMRICFLYFVRKYLSSILKNFVLTALCWKTIDSMFCQTRPLLDCLIRPWPWVIIRGRVHGGVKSHILWTMSMIMIVACLVLMKPAHASASVCLTVAFMFCFSASSSSVLRIHVFHFNCLRFSSTLRLR